MKKIVATAALAATLLISAGAFAQEAPDAPRQDWSFSGPFGTFDRAAVQRGFEIYSQVCSNCHSMNLLHYRDLAAVGFSEEAIKAIAAQKQVTDGPNDSGEMFQRPGKPADTFVSPFPNVQAARMANNGALPPDLSVIVKARAKGLEFLWGEGGPDYVYGILTGFEAAPAGFHMNQGMQYDEYFPGHQIAMPQPITDDSVTYTDGTKASLKQEAHDVVTFLTWAAEPHLEDRKHTGAKVILFLLAMTGVLYGAKRKIWKDLH